MTVAHRKALLLVAFLGFLNLTVWAAKEWLS